MPVLEVTRDMIQSVKDRRSFLTGIGLASLGVAASSLAGCSSSGTTARAQTPAATNDTAAQIFTAALIAENLAITTYFNALTGGVIQDSNLAGSGGTATVVATGGSSINVAYLRAALSEEISHAVLLRTLLGLNPDGSGDVAAGVPATFFFPTGTFDTLAGFLPILLALETAFIGAYMTAVEEFSSMAAGYNGFSATQSNPAMSGTTYTQAQLISFAKVSASILGVEAEHRALARAIPNVTASAPVFATITVLPADNLDYESSAGLTGLIVGTGSTSTTAAAALAPFLATSSANPAGFSLATALSGSAAVSLTTTGAPPTAE